MAATISTITETKAANFLKGAEARDVLSCGNLTGFHLMKLKRGAAWRYRYTDATGKRCIVTVAKYSEKKADEAARIVYKWIEEDADPRAEKATKRKSAIDAARISESRTLRNYLEKDYFRHMERWHSSASAKGTYQRLKNHFADLLDRDMVTLDQHDIRAWQTRLEDAGRTYPTIRRTYGALKTMLNTAVQDLVLTENPLKNVKLSAPRAEDQARMVADPNKAKRRMLTRDEITGIKHGLELFADELREKRRNSRAHGKPHLPDLDAVKYPNWFIPFCHLAMHTGLRPGDLYTLKWDELNIRFGRLTKMTEKSKVNLRRDKKPAIVEMTLNDTIKQIMKDWHKEQGAPAEGLVFPNSTTGRQMDKQAHKKPWNHVKELGGISPDLNFYAFRHHFISAMIKKGMPMLAVAKLAGQKSLAMIQEHYGHLCEDQAAEAVNIIESSLAGDDERRVAV